jgi:3-dehydroquinate dehydratase
VNVHVYTPTAKTHGSARLVEQVSEVGQVRLAATAVEPASVQIVINQASHAKHSFAALDAIESVLHCGIDVALVA